MTTGDRKTKTISQAKVFEGPWNPGCKAGKKGPEFFIINYTKSLFCIIEWRQKRPLSGKQSFLGFKRLFGPLGLFDCKLCCFFAAIQSLLFFTVFLLSFILFSFRFSGRFKNSVPNDTEFFDCCRSGLAWDLFSLAAKQRSICRSFDSGVLNLTAAFDFLSLIVFPAVFRPVRLPP